jgi:hypothetical protein
MNACQVRIIIDSIGRQDLKNIITDKKYPTGFLDEF